MSKAGTNQPSWDCRKLFSLAVSTPLPAVVTGGGVVGQGLKEANKQICLMRILNKLCSGYHRAISFPKKNTHTQDCLAECYHIILLSL